MPDAPRDPDPPQDLDAERAVLGLAMRDPRHLNEARTHLNGGAEFYRPAHEALWHLISRETDNGRPVDAITLNALATKDRTLRLALRNQPSFMFDLVQAANDALPDAGPYARLVNDTHRLRRWREHANRILHLTETAEPDEIDLLALDQLEQAITIRERPSQTTAATIDQFLGNDDEERYDWLIPGVLERGDRVIITADEGAGKSHLGRQLAVQTAMGLHPFTGELHQPARVLLLDLENPRNLIKREIRGMRIQAGDLLDPDMLRIESRTQGLDLADTPEDRQWLTDLVADARPDILITGPIYKMADGDPNEEKSAKPVVLFLDRLRAANRCTIWLEAHVGNESQGRTKRPQRPFGWSGWRRWPEFGLYLTDSGELTHWRGDRDQRQWPSHLLRGGEWPFRPASTSTEMHWVKIQQAITETQEPLNQRELSKILGVSQATISRTCTAYSQQYAILLGRYSVTE